MKSKGQHYLAGSEIFSNKDSYHYKKSKQFMKNESISRLRGRITSMRLLSNQLSSVLDSMQNMDYGEKILIKYSDTEWFSGNLFSLNDEESMSGYGTYHYKNGDEYEGFFLDGMRNGIGEYRYNNKSSEYIGQWKDDKRNGNGSLKIAKYEYDGEWNMNNPYNCFVFKIVESTDVKISYKNNTDFINYITTKESNEVLENLKKLNDTGNNESVELVAYIKNGRLIHYIMCETDLHEFLNLNKDLNISNTFDKGGVTEDIIQQKEESSLRKHSIDSNSINKSNVNSIGEINGYKPKIKENISYNYENNDSINYDSDNVNSLVEKGEKNKMKNTNISNIDITEV